MGILSLFYFQAVGFLLVVSLVGKQRVGFELAGFVFVEFEHFALVLALSGGQRARVLLVGQVGVLQKAA